MAAAVATMTDYSQMLRPQLYDLCLERGFQGVAKRTKRELASLLESADREEADLRLLRHRRRMLQQQQAEEERQMKMADATIADLRLWFPEKSTQQKQQRTLTTHILKAIMHGFPCYPILSAILFAAIPKQKVEATRATATTAPIKPVTEYFLEEHQLYQAQTQTQAHPTFTIYPFIPLNEASGPYYKRHD